MKTQISEPSLTDPERLAALRRYGSVRQDAAANFSRVAKLAAKGLNVKGALICWVGEASLRFAGAYGLELNDLLPRTLPKRLSLFLPQGLVQSRDSGDLQTISSSVLEYRTSEFFCQFAAAHQHRASSGLFVRARHPRAKLDRIRSDHARGFIRIFNERTRFAT